MAAEIDPIKLLLSLKWAQTRSEARRMLYSGGVVIGGANDNILDKGGTRLNNLDYFYCADEQFFIRYGRRRIARILLEECFDVFIRDAVESGEYEEVLNVE